MSTLGIPVTDRNIAALADWLDDVGSSTGPDRQRAYHALRAGLHTLRDRLTVDETAQLAAQLPTFVRGIYFEGWDPSRTPTKERTAQAFLEAVAAKLPPDDPPVEPKAAVNGVFYAMQRHVDPAELTHVRDQLPAEVKEMMEAA